MGQEHFLSVIVPLYNAEEYIERCLKSILELRIPKEIMVVDDGSTDGSADKVRAFADAFPEIRLYRQPNKGVSEARNLGLAKSRGDIIAFVDSDDYIVADSFERLYRRFASADAEMAMGGTTITFPDRSTETRRAKSDMRELFFQGQDCFAKLMRSNTFTPLVFCYLFRKDFLDRCRLVFRHRMSEDDLWTTCAMCMAKKVYVSEELHSVYCKRNDSITGSSAGTRFKADSHIAVAYDLYSFLVAQQLAEDARSWLCCKILYLASEAIRVYAELGDTHFEIDRDMFRDLVQRVLEAHDIQAKRVGMMFSLRITDILKRALASHPS